MARSNYRRRHPVVGTTTRKSQPYNVAFNGGLRTYKPNDEMKDSELLVLDNNRFERIGRPKTRKGQDVYSTPVGETVNVQQTSTTGASTQAITTINHVAVKFVAASSGRATKAETNLRYITTAPVGVLLATLHEDDGGAPGTEIASSSFTPSQLTGSAQYLTAYFPQAPDITNGTTYWLVLKAQEGTTGSFYVTTTTSASTSLTSADSGVSWSATSFDANAKLYTATSGGVKGLYRAYRPNGSATTYFAHDDDIYSVNDGTGAVTAIKSALGNGISRVRFEFVQDVLYYVTGIGKPRKYDPTAATEEEVSTAPYNASLIREHKGLLFFNDTDDKTRIYFSNFAEYDSYTSTDFIYVPAPKSSDGVVAFGKLNGAFFPYTKTNKYVLLGSDNATFSLDEAPAQKGTFSQESLVEDGNFHYFASDDGVYKFNGTTEDNIALDILEDYLSISNKENIVLELNNNRLYVFYTPDGASENRECFVYNILLKQWESRDTRTYVSATFSRHDTTSLFLQGSNRVGAVYYAERSTNDHSNLGDVIEFEVGTAFMHFGAPDQKKRITKWRPDFPAQDRPYSVSCGYAVNGSSTASFPYSVSVGSTGTTWDSGATFDSGVTFADNSMIDPSNMSVPGEHKRVQLRYKHAAAREPVEIESHVMTVQVQRIK